MLRNYFTIAVRNLIKSKFYSAVNIVGLALGISAYLLISLYVNYENNYDENIQDIDYLYRVLYERETETGEKVQFASASPNIGPVLKEQFPEIKNFARAFRVEDIISFEDISFHEKNILWAEPEFIELFSYKMIYTISDSLLNEPNTVVISDKIALKYFDNDNPTGNILKLNKNQYFKIVGVFKAPPSNMHFDADILLSYINLDKKLGPSTKKFGWMYSGFYTYVELKEGTQIDNLNKKIQKYISEELGEFMNLYKIKIAYKLQAVKEIHLTSHYMHELKTNGNKNSVISLKIISWFIIIIAWINFVNLLAISSIRRNSEISLRKVLGGTHSQLIKQFLLESLIINSIAVLVAFVFIEASLPFFFNLTDIPSDYPVWKEIWLWKDTILIFIIGTLLAGSFSIWGVMFRKIITNIRSNSKGSTKAVFVKKVLIALQFFMAVLLIAGTISVYQQIQFMRTKESGINKSDIMVLQTPRIGNKYIVEKRKSFKKEISKYPFVKSVAFSSVIPGMHNIFNRGGIRRLNDEKTAGKNYRITELDHKFTDVYSNKFVIGRNFYEDQSKDSNSVIINVAACELLGFKKTSTAIGEKILIREKKYTIIGVIENFHQESPRLNFEPQIFRLAQRFNGYFSIKLENLNNLKKIEKIIEKEYKKFFPENPFEYFYLEDYYKKQYKSEIRFGKVFGLFSILALFITTMGILSLSAFTAEQRKKEIGIRKVMGASIKQILILLSKSYLKLLLLSFALAVPIIYILLNKWLNNFANKMEFNIWIFIIPIMLVSVFSLITVFIQTIKTANDNTANSLRYE